MSTNDRYWPERFEQGERLPREGMAPLYDRSMDAFLAAIKDQSKGSQEVALAVDVHRGDTTPNLRQAYVTYAEAVS
jgi:hypothetical protein